MSRHPARMVHTVDQEANLKWLQNVIVTPFSFAFSATRTFARDPIKVRFPATVVTHETISQLVGEPALSSLGPTSNTTGTFEMTLERMTRNRVSKASSLFPVKSLAHWC